MYALNLPLHGRYQGQRDQAHLIKHIALVHQIYGGSDIDAPARATAQEVGHVARVRAVVQAHEAQLSEMREQIEEAFEEADIVGSAAVPVSATAERGFPSLPVVKVSGVSGTLRMISDQLPAWYNCSRYTLAQNYITGVTGKRIADVGVVELLIKDFFRTVASLLHISYEYQ